MPSLLGTKFVAGNTSGGAMTQGQSSGRSRREDLVKRRPWAKARPSWSLERPGLTLATAFRIWVCLCSHPSASDHISRARTPRVCDTRRRWAGCSGGAAWLRPRGTRARLQRRGTHSRWTKGASRDQTRSVQLSVNRGENSVPVSRCERLKLQPQAPPPCRAWQAALEMEDRQ